MNGYRYGVCIHMNIQKGILFSHRKEIMSFVATRADLEFNKLNKVSQILYDIAYKWNLKNDANKLTYKQKQTHRHRKHICGY